MQGVPRLWTLAACLALAAGLASGKEAVLTGTGANFGEIVTGNDFVAVEFYANWCGHCKKLAPEWEKAAKLLRKNDPPIALVKVEATEEGNKELASKYGVQGFPTIKVMRFGTSCVDLFVRCRFCLCSRHELELR